MLKWLSSWQATTSTIIFCFRCRKKSNLSLTSTRRDSTVFLSWDSLMKTWLIMKYLAEWKLIESSSWMLIRVSGHKNSSLGPFSHLALTKWSSIVFKGIWPCLLSRRLEVERKSRTLSLVSRRSPLHLLSKGSRSMLWPHLPQLDGIQSHLRPWLETQHKAHSDLAYAFYRVSTPTLYSNLEA